MGPAWATSLFLDQSATARRQGLAAHPCVLGTVPENRDHSEPDGYTKRGPRLYLSLTILDILAVVVGKTNSRCLSACAL